MSRYHPDFFIEPMVQAVAAWKTAAFGSQKSLFLTDSPVWTIEHISELVTFFVENLDESDATFWTKLENQMAPASMSAKVLLVEILWLMLIFPRTNIKSETKRERILSVWKWSGRTDNPPMQFLSDDILQGIGGVGMFFNNIWRELKFAIILFKALLEKNPEYLQKILNDPWEWGEWQVEIPDHGSRQFYHMLSFLLFPDDYESICSYSEKKKILISFDNSEQSDFKSMKPVTVDQQLFELRKRLETDYGTVALSFYRAPLLNKWKKDDATDSPLSFKQLVEQIREQLETQRHFNIGRKDHTKRWVWIADKSGPIKTINAHYEIITRNKQYFVDLHFEGTNQNLKKLFYQTLDPLPEGLIWFDWSKEKSIRVAAGIPIESADLVDKLLSNLYFLDEQIGEKVRKILNEQTNTIDSEEDEMLENLIEETDENYGEKDKDQIKTVNTILYGPSWNREDLHHPTQSSTDCQPSV